jgi:hypothetical protein
MDESALLLQGGKTYYNLNIAIVDGWETVAG